MAGDRSETDFAVQRHQMVEDQIRARGVSDERVLAALERVPRHRFVPLSQQSAAYTDGPLPIGMGQTISQPYMVARMTELLALRPSDRVLEVGTGSGYQAAVLGELAAEIWTIERLEELATRAAALLKDLGYHNVHVVTGDGSLGLPDHAPYDAIIVTAGAPSVPQALLDQLAVGGRLVIPVHEGFSEDLRLIERLPDEPGETSAPLAAPEDLSAPPAPENLLAPATSRTPQPRRARYRETSILSCSFVPLIGEQGYKG